MEKEGLWEIENEKQAEDLLAELSGTQYWKALEYYRERWNAGIVWERLSSALGNDTVAYALRQSGLAGQGIAVDWYKNKASDILKKREEAQKETDRKNGENQ